MDCWWRFSSCSFHFCSWRRPLEFACHSFRYFKTFFSLFWWIIFMCFLLFFEGLRRTGKSCRLRWLNYLKPDVKRGNLSPQEQLLILDLHSRWGNRYITFHCNWNFPLPIKNLVYMYFLLINPCTPIFCIFINIWFWKGGRRLRNTYREERTMR